jgi:cytochrome b involved in lipid metabolism
MINRDVFHMQNVMQLHDNALISDIDYRAWLAFTVAQVITPGGSECWNMMKVSYTPTIVETIEAYIKANPSAPSMIELYPKLYGENVDPTSKSESIA